MNEGLLHPKMKFKELTFQFGFASVPGTALWTALLAGVALFITFIASHTWDWFILAPCLLALGWLATLLIFHASIRAHRALLITTAILAVLTGVAYGPSLAPGSGGCMSGLIFFSCIPFTIGFPIVFTICWFLYGLNRVD
jgi:hypothetical protein